MPALLTVTNLLDAGPGSLRQAISDANDESSHSGADTIAFASSLFGGGDAALTLTSIDVNIDGFGPSALRISSPVTIRGPSGNSGLTIRRDPANLNGFRLFYVFNSATPAGASLTLENLTLSGGIAVGSSSVVPGQGGAVLNRLGTVILTNTALTDNRAQGGIGGGQGGALFNHHGNVTITNSTFSANFASGSGPGLGGAVFNYNGALTALNATFSHNTVSDSFAATLRGGVYSLGDGASPDGNLPAQVTLNNTILANTVGGADFFHRAINGGTSTASAGQGNIIEGNGPDGNNYTGFSSAVDPVLAALADNGGPTRTHALGRNSPALMAGSAAAPGFVPFDQRETPRDKGAPDIGAFEVQHPLAPVGVPSSFERLFAPHPSANANEAFVKGLYRATLLRDADDSGLANWVNALNAGRFTREQVARGFVNSTENRSNQVQFFYSYFLGRKPDAAGLNSWVQQLQSGVDEGVVMTGFILSTEFSGRNNNSSFVHLMYYALLSRQPDTIGFSAWVTALDGGRLTRADVVKGFLRSQEGVSRVVNSFYLSYLGRYGEPAALDTWRNRLSKGTTFGNMAVALLASGEFFTNAGNNL